MRFALAILSCLVSPFVLGAENPASPEAAKKVRDVTAIKNFVEITVTLPEKGVAGDTLPLTISIRNTGKVTVTYGYVSGIGDYQLVVTGEDGNSVPVTRFGKWWLETVGKGRDRFKYIVEKL